MTEKKKKEGTTGASYIMNFYKEVLNLNEYHAQYLNFLIEAENKYADIEKASEVEKNTIKIATQNVRLFCTKAYIQYNAIYPALKLTLDPKIEETYGKIKTEFILDRNDIEKYVILLNKVLVNEVIKELLDKSEELVSGAFASV